MVVEKDQSALLPNAPPPRPARREAAIEAALRKFDGAEEPAAVTEPRRSSWASGHRPELAVAMAAALVVVVAIPVMRNQVPTPEGTATPIAQQRPRAVAEAPRAPPLDAPVASEPLASPRVGSAQPARKYRGGEPAVAASSEAVAARAPPAPATETQFAGVSPRAPSPPAASERDVLASADQAAEQASGRDVIVTGSRIPSPNLAAPSPLEARGGEDPANAAFLSQLQVAVRAGDRRAVIGLIALPLRVDTAGGRRLYRDTASVERDFGKIFTAKVRRAIVRQRADRLQVRGEGVMVGGGAIWFGRVCPGNTCSPPGPVRIKAVNP